LIVGQRAVVDAETAHELANKFRFTRSQIARAVQSAADRAASRGDAMNRGDLYSGAQAHASLRLGHLAQRISPRYTWNHLILPPDPLTQLQELAARIQYAHMVNDEWGFAKNGSGGRGVSALFAGESGTGKTLAAEVIAGDLGLVLYKIDLSAVVSKYIGETEKNLNSIFSEAQSGNAILFFDEADALFGKRSEVRDAHDRYANIEVAYLLQQIEDYDGLVVLATNFRQNIDEAFTRRLDFLIDFPFPDAPYRQQIWAAHFPTNAPLSAEVNLAEVAARYRLAGGNIRNAALAAAYLAAADGQVITSAHIRSAIRREHQKMGRLLDEG
jgi:SpoVK/Ycf46/Vps4 family AAA+-type ATPase